MDEEEQIKNKKMEKMLETKPIVEVTDDNFEEKVINKSNIVPVVVDFWASWCAPCKILGPVLEKLAKEYKGKFILAKADIDSNRNKAQEYGIRSIPVVKMFKDEEVVDEFTGSRPEPMVKKWLDKNLDRKAVECRG